MKIQIVCYLFFFSFNIVFSQTHKPFCKHDSLVYLGNQLQEQKKYVKALKLYQEAINLIPNDGQSPYFDAAYCTLMLDNEDMALEYIKNGVSKSGFNEIYLSNYSGFDDFRKTTFWEIVEKNYPKWRKIYFQNEVDNIDVYLKVEKLINRDQFTRKIRDYLNNYSQEDIKNAFDSLQIAEISKDSIKIKKYQKIIFGNGNESERLQNDLMIKVDSLNATELMAITKKHGWQPRAWLILWHHRGNHDEDDAFWNYFRPLINKGIDEGSIRPSFWAIFNDFKAWAKDGGTVYGTHPGVPNDFVNEKRKEVCLPPLKR